MEIGYEIAFGTGHRRDNLVNTFIQDEVKLTNSLWLTLGSKFEHNAYTGFEFEPSTQLVWTPSLRHTVWARGRAQNARGNKSRFGVGGSATVMR